MELFEKAQSSADPESVLRRDKEENPVALKTAREVDHSVSAALVQKRSDLFETLTFFGVVSSTETLGLKVTPGSTKEDRPPTPSTTADVSTTGGTTTVWTQKDIQGDHHTGVDSGLRRCRTRNGVGVGSQSEPRPRTHPVYVPRGRTGCTTWYRVGVGETATRPGVLRSYWYSTATRCPW